MKMKTLKSLLLGLLVFLPMVSYSFDYPTQIANFNISTSAAPTWSAFKWTFGEYDDSKIIASFDVGNSTGYMFRISNPKDTYWFTAQGSCSSVTTNQCSLEITVPRTNLPPNGIYWAEFMIGDAQISGAVTNLFPTRTVARGRVTIVNSLYSSTNAANYTPVNILYQYPDTIGLSEADPNVPLLSNSLNSRIVTKLESNTYSIARQSDLARITALEGHDTNTVVKTGDTMTGNLSISNDTSVVMTLGGEGDDAVRRIDFRWSGDSLRGAIGVDADRKFGSLDTTGYAPFRVATANPANTNEALPIGQADGRYVFKTGDTMTGHLSVPTATVSSVLSFPSTNGNWYLARYGDQDNSTWHLSFNGYIPPDGSPWTFAEVASQPCYLIGFESKFDNGAFIGGESYISYLPIGSTNWRNREMGYYNATNGNGYKCFADQVSIRRGVGGWTAQPENDLEVWGQSAFRDNVIVGYETSETNRTDGKQLRFTTFTTTTASTNILGEVMWGYDAGSGYMTTVVERVEQHDYYNTIKWKLFTLDLTNEVNGKLTLRASIEPWLANTNAFIMSPETRLHANGGIMLGGIWTNQWPGVDTSGVISIQHIVSSSGSIGQVVFTSTGTTVNAKDSSSSYGILFKGNSSGNHKLSLGNGCLKYDDTNTLLHSGNVDLSTLASNTALVNASNSLNAQMLANSNTMAESDSALTADGLTYLKADGSRDVYGSLNIRNTNAVGSEMVTNGDFSSGWLCWSHSGAAIISGGRIVLNDGLSDAISPSNAVIPIPASQYAVSFNIGQSSTGRLSVSWGATVTNYSWTAPSNFYAVLIPTSTNAFQIAVTSTAGQVTFDDVSLKMLTANNDANIVGTVRANKIISASDLNARNVVIDGGYETTRIGWTNTPDAFYGLEYLSTEEQLHLYPGADGLVVHSIHGVFANKFTGDGSGLTNLPSSGGSGVATQIMGYGIANMTPTNMMRLAFIAASNGWGVVDQGASSENDPYWTAASNGMLNKAEASTQYAEKAVTTLASNALAYRAPLVTNPVYGCVQWFDGTSWLRLTNMLYDATNANFNFFWNSTNCPTGGAHFPKNGEQAN